MHFVRSKIFLAVGLFTVASVFQGPSSALRMTSVSPSNSMNQPPKAPHRPKNQERTTIEDEFQSGVVVSPAIDLEEKIYGGSVPELLSRVQRPLLLIPTKVKRIFHSD